MAELSKLRPCAYAPEEIASATRVCATAGGTHALGAWYAEAAEESSTDTMHFTELCERMNEGSATAKALKSDDRARQVNSTVDYA